MKRKNLTGVLIGCLSMCLFAWPGIRAQSQGQWVISAWTVGIQQILIHCPIWGEEASVTIHPTVVHLILYYRHHL